MTDKFIVYIGPYEIPFIRGPNNPYYYKPQPLVKGNQYNNLPTNKMVNFLITLEENKKFYTERQFKKAKQAHDFFHAMGTPSVLNLLSILQMNLVSDFPVTLLDVKLAEKIFGPNISMIKGKTIHCKPMHVVANYIEIPREPVTAQRRLTLAIDGMFINTLYFLATILLSFYYQTTH